MIYDLYIGGSAGFNMEGLGPVLNFGETAKSDRNCVHITMLKDNAGCIGKMMF